MRTSTPRGGPQVLGGSRVVPVVVASGAAQGLGVADALAAGGMNVAEITFRVEGAAEAIRAVASERPNVVVGAGTVVNVDQVDLAVRSGARFLVSPGLSRAVVERAQEHGISIVPGVATPSDIIVALELGLTTVKLFPAVPLGGLALLRAFAAPFPQVEFVPTGGIGMSEAATWLSEPAVAAVGGSWMVPGASIAALDWPTITTLATQTMSTLTAQGVAP